MDRNDAKSTSSPVIGATPERAAAGSHHQLLRDRLTKAPAPGAVAPAPSAACSHNQPGVPEPAAASKARERRRMPRRRMLKGGVMSFNGPFSGLQCTVRDLSEAGARLKVEPFVKVPETFELVIEIDGLYAQSHIVWRKGPDIGVRFTEPVRTGAKLREQVITPRT